VSQAADPLQWRGWHCAGAQAEHSGVTRILAAAMSAHHKHVWAAQ